MEEKREKARKDKEKKEAEKKAKGLSASDARKASREGSVEDDNNLVDRLLGEIRAGTKLRHRDTKRTSSVRRGSRRGLGISNQDAVRLQEIAKLATVAVVGEANEVKENGHADHNSKGDSCNADNPLIVTEAWAS